jgi:putative transposase
MARAHRHYLPGCVWHLTHRCHRKQFLLRFAKDRRTWGRWLHVAKRATAVETGEHLARCLIYVDLNMVRAGVVRHAAGWESAGYHEIQNPRSRFGVIDRGALAEALGVEPSALSAMHAE